MSAVVWVGAGIGSGGLGVERKAMWGWIQKGGLALGQSVFGQFRFRINKKFNNSK